MNRRQFIVLVAVFALVAAAGWIVYQRGNTSWQSAGQTIGGKLLPNLPVNDVAQITIISGTNLLVLARRQDLWRVSQRDDYPADFSKISDLLVKLADLKIVQNEEIEQSQLARFDLLAPDAPANSGTLLELNDQTGKTLASLLLGKNHVNQGGDQGWPDGRFVMIGNDAKTIAVISDTLDTAQPKPEDWLDKKFFKIENPESISVTFSVPTNSWELTRDSLTNAWQLAGAKPGEALDSSKLDGVTNPFDSPDFDDVSPRAAAPKDATRVDVETFEGLLYTADLWPDANENYFMTISVTAASTPAKNEKPDDAELAADEPFENWTYQIPGYTVDSLLKPRSQLLIETNATASPKSVASK